MRHIKVVNFMSGAKSLEVRASGGLLVFHVKVEDERIDRVLRKFISKNCRTIV